MSNFTITVDDVMSGLTRIVRAEPNRVGTLFGSSGCAYAVVEDGRLVASCIVGQFFANLGLLGLLVQDPLIAVTDSRTEPSQDGACSIAMFDIMTEKWGVVVEDDAANILRAVQSAQDDGAVWSVAFAQGLRSFHAEKVGELESNRLVAWAEEVEANV